MELLEGITPPFLYGIAGVDGDAVDAEFRRDAECEFQRKLGSGTLRSSLVPNGACASTKVKPA